MDSPDNKSGKSADAKSTASKTSISVKIPSVHSAENVRKVIGSPALRTPDVTHRAPHGEFVATLEGQEFGQYRQVPSPISSRASELKDLRSPSPGKTLRQSTLSGKELIRRAAATIIEKAWISYRDRQMFRLLKHAVCAAESSLSVEILKKVCPKEAEFLNDRCCPIKVRFRFGGAEFPPMIHFKVFLHSDGKGVKYLSGKRVIKPASGAAEDSLKLMGNRKFYDQMLQDAMFQRQYKITDEVDVTTLKDYMQWAIDSSRSRVSGVMLKKQYLANVDETPASLGGKENYWRRLTLDVLPRHTIFYDLVDFLYTQRMTPRLRAEIPLLVTRPVTQDIQVQQIRAISEIRSLEVPMPSKSKLSGYIGQVSGRRSKQARIRAMKMRKMYGLDKERSDLDSRGQTAVSEEPDDYFYKYGITGEEGNDGEDWEKEAKKLYEWTQELSFNDDLMATPRLLTSTNIS